MKAIRCLAFAAMLCAPAAAQPIHLTGTVAGKPVFMDLMRNGDTVTGWYFYLRVGKEIRLQGKLDHNGFFQIEEYVAATNTRSGTFTGRAQNGHWKGEWKNAAGRAPHDIALDETRDRLGSIEGRFHCTSRRHDARFGYTYTQKVDISLAKGRVKQLSLFRGERSADGDDQSCSLDLTDLHQVPASTGILLRAKGDSPKDPQHCTVRLYNTGDYLVIRTGDASQEGDDCRGVADATFCSPRSLWADVIVNMDKQTCKPVE